jgi:hypothetical protein
VAATLRAPSRNRYRLGRRHCFLQFEQLEPRNLLSAPAGPYLPHVVNEIESNDTLDQAQGLPDLNAVGQIQVLGQVGNSSAGTADVDWYSFTLDRASSVRFDVLALPARSPLESVLTLYNSDPNDPLDRYDLIGHRLLTQVDGATQGGNAHLVWSLAAGTYYLAVSGSGNYYFNPLLAGSGYPGSTGPYDVTLSATDLRLTSSDGPAVLASDPQAGGNLSRSPFVLRFDLSSALATGQSLLQGVQLIWNATGQFGQRDQVLPLAGWNFSPSANELQLTPSAPLAPGFYQVLLSGLESPGRFVLTDTAGQPLGKDPLHPLGQDYVLHFRVNGIEGNTALTTSGDNTPATARPLGDVTNAGLVQVAGAIGDDPTDPVPFDASDVDLYRFQVSGTGHYALSVEVFAGRIGSPLNPAVSLLQYDPVNNVFHILQANDDTQNTTIAHDGSSTPLFFDAAFTAGLNPGTYYLAVTDSGNAPLPDPAGLPLITFDTFDPVAAQQSGMGFTTGNYVLNLLVKPDNDAPQVKAVTLGNGSPLQAGAVLSAPPSQVNFTFSEPVSLVQLLQGTMMETGASALQAAYIQGGGNQYFLHFVSMSADATQAHFILYDRLPAGSYELHLSGAAGLTDLGGNPLVGSQPGGDFVIPFTVAGPTLGLVRMDVEPNDFPSQAQDLGVLFPFELVNSVQIVRDAAAAANGSTMDTADYYKLTLLQTEQYNFLLNSAGTVPGLQVSISGGSLSGWVSLTGAGNNIRVLSPGTYLLQVSGWTAQQRLNVAYQLNIFISQFQEAPPPLTVGPAPFIQIRRVAGTVPVPGPSLPPVPALPPGEGGSLVPVGLGTQPSLANDIPVTVLSALAAGPLGGVGLPGQAPDNTRGVDPALQAVALGTGLFSPELLLSLPVLVPVQDSGKAEITPLPSALGLMMHDVVIGIKRIDWAWAIEYLHGVAHHLALPEISTSRTEDATPAEEGLEDTEALDGALGALDRDAASSTTLSLAAMGLCLIPGLALIGPIPSATSSASRRGSTPDYSEGAGCS